METTPVAEAEVRPGLAVTEKTAARAVTRVVQVVVRLMTAVMAVMAGRPQAVLVVLARQEQRAALPVIMVATVPAAAVLLAVLIILLATAAPEPSGMLAMALVREAAEVPTTTQVQLVVQAYTGAEQEVMVMTHRAAQRMVLRGLSLLNMPTMLPLGQYI